MSNLFFSNFVKNLVKKKNHPTRFASFAAHRVKKNKKKEIFLGWPITVNEPLSQGASILYYMFARLFSP